jgi:DNA-binding transcriptional LysR family regulator
VIDINFELYKLFYHAARLGNFSIAARQLFITQSAVSQGIKQLETKLNTRLFYRRTRQLKLTPEGELLFSHIGPAYNLIKTAEQKITELQNLDAGEIRIGASDTICKYYLLPYIEQFTRQFPRIKFQLVNRTSAQLVEILKQGLIDFAIITLPLSQNAIVTRTLAVVEDIWVAAPNRFGELQGQTLAIAELARYPLLLLDKSSATRQILDQFLQQHGINVQPEVELESIDLLVEFARIGRGIAPVLRESAHAALASGELFEVMTDVPLPRRQLGSATLKTVPLSQAAERFEELLRDSWGRFP